MKATRKCGCLTEKGVALSHAGRFQDARQLAVLESGFADGSTPFQATGAKGKYDEHLEYISED